MKNWDADPQVRSPVGRPLEELLAVRQRRQQLDGFEPIYSDIVDYIVRCTHRIWEEKNIGLCRTHYAEKCVVHTSTGPVAGLEAVVQGTVGTIAAYADRQVIAEDVVWSEDEPGLFHSSHRIMSRSTHNGHDALFGAPTGRIQGATTVADCLVRENLIVEEWLVRDNLRSVLQLGLDPWALSGAQAEADLAGDPTRHAWRQARIAAVRESTLRLPPREHPAAVPTHALALAFAQDLYGEAAAACAASVEARWPSNRRGWGRGTWIGYVIQLRSLLDHPCLSLDHWAARPLPGGDIAVALRWTLTGEHRGAGAWGPPTGRAILVLAVSHYVLRGNTIIQDITVFDELAILRQIRGGLGAGMEALA
ncbi:MAG: hypothetical protein ACREFT_18545 [Acetobacteraceae bacterium]